MKIECFHFSKFIDRNINSVQAPPSILYFTIHLSSIYRRYCVLHFYWCNLLSISFTNSFFLSFVFSFSFYRLHSFIHSVSPILGSHSICNFRLFDGMESISEHVSIMTPNHSANINTKRFPDSFHFLSFLLTLPMLMLLLLLLFYIVAGVVIVVIVSLSFSSFSSVFFSSSFKLSSFLIYFICYASFFTSAPLCYSSLRLSFCFTMMANNCYVVHDVPILGCQQIIAMVFCVNCKLRHFSTHAES